MFFKKAIDDVGDEWDYQLESKKPAPRPTSDGN
jgi:hypothetical protein